MGRTLKTKCAFFLGLVGVVAAIFAAPSLTAASATETQVAGAAAGVFPKGVRFNGLVVQQSRIGFGVVVRGDGSAVGQFQTVLAATTLTGQPRSISIDGKATRGTVTPSRSVTLSGTATLQVDSLAPTTVPFRVTATATGLQLTLGTLDLPRQTLTAGSIYVG
jgi:hypothetical protein